jgi:putative sterol carrier protein
MADTNEFFSDYLPNKVKNDPSLAEDINAVFQFNIEGAGEWTLDLTGEGSVAEGTHDDPGCVLTCDKETWETILDNPSEAMKMFMFGKLKASNIGLATKLQKILA